MLPDPNDVAAYDESLAKLVVGGEKPLTGPIEIRDYDPEWPRLYEREEARIRSILGERVVRIEHAGSTSVPGLPAKPIIDIALEVPDSADEAAYVPDLEAAGYALRIREPDWFTIFDWDPAQGVQSRRRFLDAQRKGPHRPRKAAQLQFAEVRSDDVQVGSDLLEDRS